MAYYIKKPAILVTGDVFYKGNSTWTQDSSQKATYTQAAANAMVAQAGDGKNGGFVGATVVTMGLLSLPTMLKRGYSPTISTGTICDAGTLVHIIPPSIVLILLGDQISAAYQKAQLAKGNFSPDSCLLYTSPSPRDS